MGIIHPFNDLLLRVCKVFNVFATLQAWYYSPGIIWMDIQFVSWNYGQLSMSIALYWVDPVIWALEYQQIKL